MSGSVCYQLHNASGCADSAQGMKGSMHKAALPGEGAKLRWRASMCKQDAVDNSASLPAAYHLPAKQQLHAIMPHLQSAISMISAGLVPALQWTTPASCSAADSNTTWSPPHLQELQRHLKCCQRPAGLAGRPLVRMIIPLMVHRPIG